MPELKDLTPEQIDAVFTQALLEAEAQAWMLLCQIQGEATLARQDRLADNAARWGLTTVPMEERLDPGEA